jgi:hypothetical protein
MIRLTLPTAALDGTRSRHDGCLEQPSDFLRVRNGTCCRKAIETTKRCIDAFQAWCSNEVVRRVLRDVANELRDKGALDEEESFIDATFAMAEGRGRGDGSDQAWKSHENHGESWIAMACACR